MCDFNISSFERDVLNICLNILNICFLINLIYHRYSFYTQLSKDICFSQIAFSLRLDLHLETAV